MVVSGTTDSVRGISNNNDNSICYMLLPSGEYHSSSIRRCSNLSFTSRRMIAGVGFRCSAWNELEAIRFN